MALGKLGSRELNYASDIDLIFIYSDDGTTAGSPEQGKLSNREYFIKVSETITRLVGQPAGEGAAYRVDLRLRPHGRDGALACSLDEALKYYRKSAQPGNVQALIRSRAAAVPARFFPDLPTPRKITFTGLTFRSEMRSPAFGPQEKDRSTH